MEWASENGSFNLADLQNVFRYRQQKTTVASFLRNQRVRSILLSACQTLKKLIVDQYPGHHVEHNARRVAVMAEDGDFPFSPGGWSRGWLHY